MTRPPFPGAATPPSAAGRGAQESAGAVPASMHRPSPPRQPGALAPIAGGVAPPAAYPAPTGAPPRVAPPMAGATRAGEPETLLTVIERLNQLLVEEAEALRQNRLADLPRLTERKGQGLLEVMRLARHRPPGPLGTALKEALTSLRSLLAHNRRLLQNHIDAVTETAAIVQRAIAASEDDGTYSMVAGKGVTYR